MRYHFLTDAEIAANQANEYNNMTELTETQRTGFEQALSVLNKITGVKFAESADVENANILFSTADLGQEYAGFTAVKHGWGADVITVNLSNDYDKEPANVNPTFGHEGFGMICHELGHAMGLSHPFTTAIEPDGLRHITLPKQIETNALTVMSYDRADSVTNAVADEVAPWCNEGDFYYSPVDILALQYLYGTDGINGEEGIIYDTTVLA